LSGVLRRRRPSRDRRLLQSAAAHARSEFTRTTGARLETRVLPNTELEVSLCRRLTGPEKTDP
jgi:hypothetical protein